MTASHTPGPWQIRAGTRWIETPHGLGICQMPSTSGEPDRAAQDAANARLIAAAPDLLAALQGILASFHESVRTDMALDEFPALKAVADAIAKATTP